MPIWTTTSVADVPVIDICRWMLIRTERDEVHIIGFNLTEGQGRVSRALRDFDPVTRIGHTPTGRCYRLVGESGYDGDAWFTFSRWCELYKVESWTDVSAEVLASGLATNEAGTK